MAINVVEKKKTLEEEVKRRVEQIFDEKCRWIGMDNIKLQVSIATGIWGPPVVGENVYAEAFPFETSPRVWIEVWPDATDKEIVGIVCHELIHIKHPELGEESEGFKKKVQACIHSRRR